MALGIRAGQQRSASALGMALGIRAGQQRSASALGMALGIRAGQQQSGLTRRGKLAARRRACEISANLRAASSPEPWPGCVM